MRSCLILGSGRSGTSMVAGCLSGSGYHHGGTLHAPRAANPKGFFETAEVNGLNDALLRLVRPQLPGGQGWLCALPAGVPFPAPSPAMQQAIRAVTAAKPFCIKDPRLSHTLPLWQPHLPEDTAFVVVFRHPLLTATSMVEEARRASYLRGKPLDIASALSVWVSSYRSILRQRAAAPGRFLFVHYDQMLTDIGPSKLSAFLGASVDASFIDQTLHRTAPEGALPAEAAALYAELCALSEYTMPTTQEPTVTHTNPDVTVLALIEDGDEAGLTRIMESTASQRGVSTELVVIDATTAGGVTMEGATVVRSPSVCSRGAGYLAGLQAATGRYIAWADGACWRMPNQLARLAEILDVAPDAAMVVSDYHISLDGDRFEGTIDLKACVESPLPGWRSSVLLRRVALELIPQTAFWPSELALMKMLRGVNRVIHIGEPLFTVDARALEAGFTDAARDGASVSASSEPWGDAPILTVNLCTYNRKETLRSCLTAICRQNIPTGSFVVTVVDDGSTDGTAEMLSAVTEWPVPVKVIRRDNGGLAAARNTGLTETSTPLVMFINDDTIAAGDLVLTHIQAHDATPGHAILGSFPQPEAAMSGNLTNAVEQADLMFCFNQLSTEQPNPAQFFYTCNVSVSTDLVMRAGGFDEDFRHYGAEDTDMGLRLGRLGMTVRYVPSAKATHRHPYTFDYLRRRAELVAKAHVRLWRKHPDQVIDADIRADRCPTEAELAPYIAAAETLSTVDLGALRGAGMDALAKASSDQLIALLNALNPQWWHRGISAGLQEHGYESLLHLLAEHPFDIPEVREKVWVMAPTMDAAETWVQRALQFRDSFSSNDPVTLVLLAGIEGGYSPEMLAEGLRAFNADDTPHIAIVQTGLPEAHSVRMFAAADGWVPTGSAQDTRWAMYADIVGCPAVEPRADQAPWPLASASATKLLAWPTWGDDTDLRALLTNYAATLSGKDVTLCLRVDPSRVDLATALSRLETLAAEVLPDGGENLDILVIEDRIPDAALPRLGRAVNGLLALPSNPNPEALGRTLGIPVVHSAAELRAHIPA